MLPGAENRRIVDSQVELTFVIPVYNGSRTVGKVVEDIHQIYADLDLEGLQDCHARKYFIPDRRPDLYQHW